MSGWAKTGRQPVFGRRGARASFAARAGFTLIELLVVISIIGMLSSVIMVGLQSAREKAQVAAGIKFAAYNYQLLGAYKILYMDFNNGTLNDSGSFNNWSVSGSSYSIPAGSPSGSGSSLSLSSGGKITAQQPVGVVGPDFGSHTLSFWIKWTATGSSLALLMQGSGAINTPCGTACVRLNMNNNGSITSIGPTNCAIDPATSDNAALPKDKWMQVTYTMDAQKGSTGTASFYINGKAVVSDRACISRVVDHLTSLVVGRSGFIGSFDDVAIFGAALTAREVGQLYAAGLPTHQVAVLH